MAFINELQNGHQMRQIVEQLSDIEIVSAISTKQKIDWSGRKLLIID